MGKKTSLPQSQDDEASDKAKSHSKNDDEKKAKHANVAAAVFALSQSECCTLRISPARVDSSKEVKSQTQPRAIK